jgi:surfeit locus 1 family protein
MFRQFLPESKVSKLLSRKWILATILVLIAAAVMVRLGIWQLDRLKQRRAFNARVEAQLNAPPLDLNAALASGQVPDLANMDYRTVLIHGTFDYSNEVALRNQVYNENIGVHLLTPFKLTGTDQSIVVDRGWIPLEEYTSGKEIQYQETGELALQGQLRRSVETGTIWQKPDPTAAPGSRLDSLIYPNVSRIAAQSSYPLLPAYIQASPSANHTALPYRVIEQPELTEGPHMNYAIQWFAFTIILLVGYPIFVKRSEQRELRIIKKPAELAPTGKSEGQHEA